MSSRRSTKCINQPLAVVEELGRRTSDTGDLDIHVSDFLQMKECQVVEKRD